MKRRRFLNRIGLGSAVVATPVTIALLPSFPVKGEKELAKHLGSKGDLYLALFTADPDGGKDVECTYKNYKRVGVPRSTEYWEIGEDYVSNKTAITFPEAGNGIVEAVTYAGIMFGEVTPDKYFKIKVTNMLLVSWGITPQFETGALTIGEP